MGLLDDLLQFISEGTIAGLPSIVMLFIPLILGIIVGFLAKKFLKKAVIFGLILAVVIYFGLFSLSLSGLKDIIARYGPITVHYIVLLLGMLPLGVGFAIGLAIGFFVL